MNLCLLSISYYINVFNPYKKEIQKSRMYLDESSNSENGNVLSRISISRRDNVSVMLVIQTGECINIENISSV